MAARRLILVMLVLLVLSSILAALVPVERDQPEDDTTSSTTTTTEPLPTGELVRRTIAADDPTPERIELGLGDQLELTVTSSKRADQVEIPFFGELEDVDPNFQARFDLLALEPGKFAVRLVEANRVIARIEVTARRDQGKPAKSGGKDEPDKSSEPPGSSRDNSTPGASSLS